MYLYAVAVRMAMECSIHFSHVERDPIERYASANGLTVSGFIRRAVMEAIEDGLDIEICRKALKNYEGDPKTYSHDEVKRELGLL